ncbi:hypothetical protein [Sphingomonas aerolata]|uniref:hypothetical protein n=1 Tax=Sphingomonas aerolata TaxID=185951 RepID=UPI00141AD0DC|nr:hypothetical protein [Sphingomonas aerolata]NII57284.1 hypothetical protein [Sphingomonas aerolata]
MPLRPVRPSPSFGWIAAAIMVALFGAIVVGWRQRQRDVAATAIAVVRTPTIPVARIRPLPEARPAAVAPVAAVAHLRTVYPLLSDVTIACRDDRCTLSATIRPVTGQADLDRRQEMLLGGLATALAADGYRLAVPFQMDEVADNLFRIRASVTPR